MKVTNPANAIQGSFESASNVSKAAAIDPCWIPSGAMSATKDRVDPKQAIMIFNSSSSVAYVKMGMKDTDVSTAPTGPADSIPIPAGTTLKISTGPNNWIRGSSTTLFLYKASQE